MAEVFDDIEQPQIAQQEVPYAKGLYLNLQNAYGKDNLPSEDEFIKKVSSDKAYRDGVYKNLIHAYGQDNVPDYPSFEEKLKKKELSPLQSSTTQLQSVLQEGDRMATGKVLGDIKPKKEEINYKDLISQQSGKLPTDNTRNVSTQETIRGVEAKAEHDRQKKEAINNTVIQHNKMFGVGEDDADMQFGRDELENKLKDGKLQIIKSPKTGNYILARNGDFFDSYNQAFDQVKQKQADDKFVASLSTEDKIKHFEQKDAAQEDEYLPTAPHGIGGAFGKTMGENQDALVSLMSAATAGGKVAEALGATSAAVTNAQKFGSFLSFAVDAGYSGYANNTERVYKSLRQQDPNGNKIEQMKHAETAGLLGEGAGILGAAGMTGAFSRLTTAAQSINTKPLVSALETMSKHTVKESAIQGSIAAGQSVLSDLGAISQGAKIKASEVGGNALEHGTDMAKFAAIMGTAMGVAAGLGNATKYVVSQAKGILSKLPKEDLRQAYTEAEQAGVVPEGTTDKAMSDLSRYEDAMKKIPSNLPDVNKNAIAGIQEKIDKLEGYKKTLAPQFHDRVDKLIEPLKERAIKMATSENPLKYEVDDLTGQPTTTPKSYDNLSKQEREGIVVPTEHGKAEVEEKGEGENRTFKAKPYFIESDGRLQKKIPIEVEDKIYKSKEEAQKASDKALAQHYYETKLPDYEKPESKENQIPIPTEVKGNTVEEANSVEQKTESWESVGKKSKDTQDATHIGRWVLDNSKEGDTIEFNDGNGYEVTGVSTKKDGTKEVQVTPFEINEDGSKDYNHAGVRLISEQSIKNGSSLFENAYTNSNGERVVEQSKYIPKKQSISEPIKPTEKQIPQVSTKTEQSPVSVEGKGGETVKELEKKRDEELAAIKDEYFDSSSKTELDKQLASLHENQKETDKKITSVEKKVDKILSDIDNAEEEHQKIIDEHIASEQLTTEEKHIAENEKSQNETVEQYTKRSFRDYLKNIYKGGLVPFFKRVKDKVRKTLLAINMSAILIANTTGDLGVRGYIEAVKNYSERHLVVKPDTPLETVHIEKGNSRLEDNVGVNKIPYKTGFASNQIINLDSNSFEPRNRNDRRPTENAVGITTNLFKPFTEVKDFKGVLPRKDTTTKNNPPVIAVNKETGKVKAGNVKDFDDKWLVSETFTIPLNFVLDSSGKIETVYHGQAMRNVPVTIVDGKKVPFPIGLDTKEGKIDPTKHNTFGVLEGGKVILTVGDYQVQVNGGFADIYKVWQQLKNTHPNKPIVAYLLDNGSYNLPILKNDGVVNSKDLAEHTGRNKDGGTSLILKQKEPANAQNYPHGFQQIKTDNYRKDSSGNKVENKPEVIVLHHTGKYKNGEKDVINEFTKQKGNSSHYLIGKDGKVFQFNDDSYVMFHAGKSIFNGKEDLNNHSIGIEIQGDSKNGDFTKEQYESLAQLVPNIAKTYNIPIENLVSHAQIRDNYIKAHPEDKTVEPKRDLEKIVFDNIIKSIQKNYPKQKKTEQHTTKEQESSEVPVSNILEVLAGMQGLDIALRAYRRRRKSKSNKFEDDIIRPINTHDKHILLSKIEDFKKSLNEHRLELEKLKFDKERSINNIVSLQDEIDKQIKIGDKILSENKVNADKRNSIKTKYDKLINELKQQPTTENNKPISEGTEKETPIPETENKGQKGPPIEPPITDNSLLYKGSSEERASGLMSHIMEAKNIDETTKEGFRKKGINYKVANMDEARKVARGIIDSIGSKDALAVARQQDLHPSVRSAIFAESINDAFNAEQKATTEKEKLEHAKDWANIVDEWDKLLTQGGQFTSYAGHFYRTSEMGYVLKENARRSKVLDDFIEGKNVDIDSVIDEIKKTEEGKLAFENEVEKIRKEERVNERKSRDKAIDNFFEKAKLKKDNLYAVPIPVEVINGALDAMKEAVKKGDRVVLAVQKAIDHISKEIGDNWDKEKFRKQYEELVSKVADGGKPSKSAEDSLRQRKEELERRIREKDFSAEKYKEKKTLTEKEQIAKDELDKVQELYDEAKKQSKEFIHKKEQQYLDNLSKKLGKLTDEQKSEVIRKAAKKIIESGGLEREDLKKIIGDVIGVKELSPEEIVKLKELVKDINAPEKLEDAMVENPTKENIDAYEKSTLKAATAYRDLVNLTHTKEDITATTKSIVLGNLLSVPSLVINPTQNVLWQPIDFGISLIRHGANLLSTNIYKSISKDYRKLGTKVSTNPIAANKAYFKKMYEGLKESAYHFMQGTQKRNYFDKVAYQSSLSPRQATKDLKLWKSGEKFLTKGQVIDKKLRASFIGRQADFVLRGMGFGDTAPRQGAEGAKAIQFAKQTLNLIDDNEIEAFMASPKKYAYKVYKRKGLSEKQAQELSEAIEQSISRAGDERVFQDKTLFKQFSDWADRGLRHNPKDNTLTKVGKSAASTFKTMVMPFPGIPSSIIWRGYKLANPYVSLGQSFAQYLLASEARKKGNLGDHLKYSEQSKNSLAYAIAGGGLSVALGTLVSQNLIRASNDKDTKARESAGERAFGKAGMINMGKLMGGKDQWVSLGYFGALGAVLDAKQKIAERQKKNKEQGVEEEWSDEILKNMGAGAKSSLNQVFFNTGADIIDALMSGGNALRKLEMNLFNQVETIASGGGTLASISKYMLPEQSRLRADEAYQEMWENTKQRNVLVRMAANLYKKGAGEPIPKISIWGEPLKQDNSFSGVVKNVLRIEGGSDDNFGSVIFHDAEKTANPDFFPQPTSSKLEVNGKQVQLTQDEKDDLDKFVGKARAARIDPFIKGASEGENYMTLTDEQLKAEKEGDEAKVKQILSIKLKALKELYDDGKEQGMQQFKAKYPQYIDALTPKDQLRKEAKEEQKVGKLVNPIIKTHAKDFINRNY